jgi:hypothetical protein
LHDELLRRLGTPVYVMEREWEHCKEARALYGSVAYPPLGLCVSLTFSQLKHLAEQAPQAGYAMLFDCSGAVKAQLDPLLPVQAPEAVALELKHQLNAYPFHLHDAARALARKDRATAQSAIEQMRTAIYYAAAVRAGQHAHGTQRGWHSLAPGEKWVLEHSFQHATLRSVERLTDLYIACLTDLQGAYGMQQDVDQLKQAVPELLG